MILNKDDLHASLSDPVLDSMNFLNEITCRYPDAVSFAPGRPHEGYLGVDDIFGFLQGYLAHLARGGIPPEQVLSAVYQYGPTAGRIRELIADWLRKDEGIQVAAEAIVVTVGCQEAMLLALRALFTGPDDVLVVPAPCYVGITGAARLLDIPTVAVPEREDGIRAADVAVAVTAERARGKRPKAIYLMPDHANPSGATMSPQARTDMINMAESLDVLLLEDSPYRLVSGGLRLPALKSADHDCRVVYLGSFAKTAFPGARVGFAVADQQVRDACGRVGLLADELSKVKSMVTVNTPSLSQAAIAGLLIAADGRLSEFNTRTARHYEAALRTTLEQLEKHFPPEGGAHVRWNRPSGGFFITISLPFKADNAALTRSAECGVIWTPMSYFYPQGGGENMIRLSFSYLKLNEIAEGIGRLARFVELETLGPQGEQPGWHA
jgi:(S)-3,5-dihydroxyphenylglycine transaminase